MERPWIRSPKLVLPIGVNALGALQITLGQLPFVLWPDRPAGTASRLLMLLTSGCVVVGDVWWRATGREHAGWMRAVSPFEGGAIGYLPGSMVGLALAGLSVFALFDSAR